LSPINKSIYFIYYFYFSNYHLILTMPFSVAYLVFGIHLVALSFDSRDDFERWNSEMETIKAAAAHNNTLPEGRIRTAKIRRWYQNVRLFRNTWGDDRMTEDVRNAYQSAAEHIGTTVHPPFGPPVPEITEVSVHEFHRAGTTS
jgi:hypothetical protein